MDRALVGWLRVGADARVANVEFGDDYDARHTAAGVHVAFDTRIDPFPRNAIDARIGWERLAFSERDGQGRWLIDARGVGIGGPAVLAVRGQLSRADGPLPAAEQPLLGGSDPLRGYRTGHRAGDNLAALTAEVRYPLTSPLNVGRFGVKGFVDAGPLGVGRAARRSAVPARHRRRRFRCRRLHVQFRSRLARRKASRAFRNRRSF